MEKKRKEIYIYIYIDEKYETLCLYAHTIIITLWRLFIFENAK